MDAIVAFAEHALGTRYDDLPAAAIRATKTFLLDSLGVAVAGSAAPFAAELIASAEHWGRGEEVRLWVRGMRLPAPAAALCHGYQIHNSEFDCVHEGAVVHPMAVLLATVLAEAERAGGVSGRDLLVALAIGVDVAAGLGLASRAPLRFFRPATAGAFGAAAALGRLRGFARATLLDAFAITHGQLCGTMQAHAEGSPLLAMQIGFNARNALVAADMAAAGIGGPRQVLEGPFGYFPLFEGDHDLAPVRASLGRVWRITEVAHKPFPSGRATHGVLDGVLALQRQHGFSAEQVAAITCHVPPLTHRLVARPAKADMAVSYARLSAPYVIACALLRGSVDLADFSAKALADPKRLAVAARVDVQRDDNPDPNALRPVRVEVRLASGARHEIEIEQVYGSPARPLSEEAHLAKFRRNWRSGARQLPEAAGEELITLVEGLEALDDARHLIEPLVA